MIRSTEYASPRYEAADQWPTADLVDALIEGQLSAVATLRGAGTGIGDAIEAAARRLQRGGRLIYVGAGTSGRIGAQDAAELWPTFNWPLDRIAIVMAGGEKAFIRAIERSEDNEDAARAEFDRIGVARDDVVIGLAASGRTPFTIAGLEAARQAGAMTIGILNDPAGRLASVSDHAIVLDTGGELVAGSTRMKAGTAQKAALNTLSTGIMVRLGFVYRGRMVEMHATNAKLDARAISMIADLAGCDRPTAESALTSAGGSIKLAVLIAATGLERTEAEDRLRRTDGHLRSAMQGPTG